MPFCKRTRLFARYVTLGALALMLSMASVANATIMYNTWTTNDGDSGNYIVTVTENAGVFNVEVTVDPWNAEALGFFIDLGDNDIIDDTLNNESPTGQASVFDTDTSSNSCGPGCNLNGLSPPVASPDGEWEWVIRLGAQGFDGIQTFSFDLALNGLTEADWGLVGIRAQQLCGPGQLLPGGNCGGSDKSYGSPSSTPVPVPEPGALGMLGAGLLGIAVMRRRCKKVVGQ